MYFLNSLHAVVLFLQVMSTFCVSQVIDSTTINLNWWDYNLEQWQAVRCVSGGGSCIQFKGVTFRLFGAYIKRGTRLTVHINNHGTKDLQVKMIWYEIELNSNNAKDVCPFWEATNFKAQRLWDTQKRTWLYAVDLQRGFRLLDCNVGLIRAIRIV